MTEMEKVALEAVELLTALIKVTRGLGLSPEQTAARRYSFADGMPQGADLVDRSRIAQDRRRHDAEAGSYGNGGCSTAPPFSPCPLSDRGAPRRRCAPPVLSRSTGALAKHRFAARRCNVVLSPMFWRWRRKRKKGSGMTRRKFRGRTRAFAACLVRTGAPMR